MSSHLEGMDAVLFDAGFTLLEPVRSVGDVYYEKALSYDIDLDRNAFNDRLRVLWTNLRDEYRSRSPELLSSEEMERAAWRDFSAEVARPFPGLFDSHDAWLSELICHFDHPDAWRPIEGALELIYSLRAKGVRVGIVSNWHSALHEILKGHDITRHCEFVAVSSEVGRKKPHPHIFEHAIRALEIPLQCVAHVGDSWDEDVIGAKNAGLHAIYYSPSGFCPEARPAVPVIRSLSELLDS